jgi:hypothetical protein
MSTPQTVSFSATPILGGKVLIDWASSTGFTFSSDTKMMLRYTDVLINELSTDSKFNLINFNPVKISPAGANDVFSTTYTVEGLVLGREYIFHLTINDIPSTSTIAKSIDVPLKPSITIYPRDKSLAFQINNMTRQSLSDGFSEIDFVEITYAEGSVIKTMVINRSDLSSIEDFYTTIVGFLSNVVLVNEKPHEVAIRLHNLIGFSPMSDTKQGVPRDTPDRTVPVLALSDVTYSSLTGGDISTSSGAIVALIKRPGDYLNLNQQNINGVNVGPLRITQLKLKRKQYKANMINVVSNGVTSTVQSTVTPWIIDTDVPVVNLSYILNDKDSADPLFFQNTFDQVTYDYKIVDATAILGAVYSYTASFVNDNGAGEESLESVLARSMSLPSPPVGTRTMGDKTLVLTLSDYGSLNGEFEPTSNKFKYELKEGGGPFGQQTDFDLDYNQTTGTAPNQVPNPNYNSYTFNGQTNGFTLTARIYRIGIDNLAPSWVPSSNKVFKSPYLEVSGLMRVKPNAPDAVSVWAIADDFSPITKVLNGNTVPAVQVAFRPIKVGEIAKLGGYASQVGFNPTLHLRYRAYKNSQVNDEVEPIYSGSWANVTSNTIYYFVVSSPLNTTPSHYVRTEVYDLELLRWIISDDSTPPQSGSSRGYIDSPITFDIVRRTLSTEIGFQFPLNQLISGTVGGAAPADVRYHLALLRMDTNSVDQNHIKHVPYRSSDNTDPNVTYNTSIVNVVFTGLNPGSPYVAILIPYSIYSAFDIGTTTSYKFNQIKIRKNYRTKTFASASPPSAPTDFLVRPQDSALLIDFNAPANLNGTTLERYEAYAINEIINDSAPTAQYPAFPQKQKAVATVLAPEEMYINKVFKDRVSGIGGLSSDLVNIVNDTNSYSVALSAIGKIGGGTGGSNTSRTDVLPNAVDLIISYDNSVPTEYLTGVATVPIAGVHAYAAVDSPTGIATTSDATSITVLFIKNQNADEVLIKSNGEDVFNTRNFSSDNVLPVGNANAGKIDIQAGTNVNLGGSIFVTPGYTSGLFSLQQPVLSTIYKDTVQKFFNVSTINNVTYYSIKISVSNGNPQNLEVFYGRNVTGGITSYSLPAIASASAAVPPDSVSAASISIAPGQITAYWTPGSSQGGAGQIPFQGANVNSSLKFKLLLYTANGYATKTALASVDNISTNTYTFSGLANYNSSNPGTNSYFVEVVAYYNQQSDVTKPSVSVAKLANLIDPSTSQPVAIRPGAPPSPIVPSIKSLDTVAGGSVTVSLSIPSDTNYGVSKVEIYDGATIIKTVNSGFVNGQSLDITLVKDASNPNFLNGRSIPLAFVFTPNYYYAQNFANASLTVTPRKKISKTDIVVSNPSADLKTFLVTIATHGTSTSGIVAIGKTASALQVVQHGANVATSWSPTSLGTATASDAAGMTQTAVVAFATVITDALFLLNTVDGPVGTIDPPSSTAFGVSV